MHTSRQTHDKHETDWTLVPPEFHYLRSWASRLGVRGLTVYFGEQPPLEKLASQSELVELREAYETIARCGDASAITVWCLSIAAGSPANDVKESIRGLLLLFERLGDRELAPFDDGRVRYVPPAPPPFDWSVLPPRLAEFVPWLKRFEHLKTENDLYQFVQRANGVERHELMSLQELMTRDGDVLRDWSIIANKNGNPAKREAFQAEWLFLLVDFAK